MKTYQIEKWTGIFGDDYAERNLAHVDLFGRIGMWRKIISCMKCPPYEILEVGAGTGKNLQALKEIFHCGSYPMVPRFFATEPNEKSRTVLEGMISDRHPVCEHISDNIAQNLADFRGSSVDMVFTSGVLIHIHPDDLDDALLEIHRVSKKYIVCIEYFDVNGVEIPYRDNLGMMWKRDFGHLWISKFPAMRHLGHGFEWKHATGLDNVTWWIFEKGS
jgi:pseudaminic acid biosynthesis-associated methylase